MAVYSLAVHTSLGFKRENYYFRYKGREFRFIPRWKFHDSDNLITILKRENDAEADEAYRLAAELFGLVSFERDCSTIIISGSVSYGSHFKLEDCTGGYSERRSIPVYELAEDFHPIRPIFGEKQLDLIRLYREARSSNNVYLSVLFYWHILSYPGSDDEFAIAYVNQFSQTANFAQEEIKRISAKPLMLKKFQSISDLGEYLCKGVRHSIAHFTRKPTHNEKGIDLDNFEQLRHFSDVNYVLREAARQKIRHDYGLLQPHDPNIFRYTRDSDFRNSSDYT